MPSALHEPTLTAFAPSFNYFLCLAEYTWLRCNHPAMPSTGPDPPWPTASQRAVVRVRPPSAAGSDSGSGDGASSDGDGDSSDASLTRRLADVRAEVDCLLTEVARQRRRRLRRRRYQSTALGVADVSASVSGGVAGGSGGDGGAVDGGDGVGGGVAELVDLSDAASVGAGLTNGSVGEVDALLTSATAPGGDTHTVLFPTVAPAAPTAEAGEAEAPAAPVAWRAADDGVGDSGGADKGTAGSSGSNVGIASGGEGDPRPDDGVDDFMSMDPPDVSVFKHAAW